MNAQLARRISDQQRRIDEYREKIAARRQETLRLSLERQRLEEELSAFEHEYSAKVGRLYGELDRVQLEIKELLYKARLIERGDVHDERSLEKRVKRAFRVEREKVEADGKAKPPPEKPSAPKPTGKLRAFYLKLAKRYHPDKADSGESKEELKRVMALINAAYESGDLTRLRQLAATLEEADSAPEEEPPNQQERRLYREYLKLDRAARQLQREIDRFKTRDAYRLKESVEEAKERGEDMLADLRRELETKIAAAKNRLASVSSQLKELAGRFFRL